MAQTGKAFYTGLFRHTLDEKGRLTIPSAWIDAAQGLDFAALATPAVSSRVRVGLVLRAVPAPHSKQLRRSHNVRGVC